MNGEPRTQGEEEFEAYLVAAGYVFQYEKEWPGKSRRPDYVVDHGGTTLLFDVKDFDPKLPMLGFTQIEMYSGIRRQIEAGRVKFKEFKEFPCSVVLRNNGNLFARLEDPNAVLGAMYGDIGFKIPVHISGPASAAPDLPVQPAFLRGAQMLPNKNTTINALVTVRDIAVGRPRMNKIWQEQRTLSYEETVAVGIARFGETFDPFETQRGVIVWENIYARRPLPRDVFNGPYDQRFGLDENDIACIFFGRGLEELE